MDEDSRARARSQNAVQVRGLVADVARMGRSRNGVRQTAIALSDADGSQDASTLASGRGCGARYVAADGWVFVARSALDGLAGRLVDRAARDSAHHGVLSPHARAGCVH